MTEAQTTMPAIPLGDPVPWFSLPSVTGGRVDLHVDAGRWVVLCFLGSLADPKTAAELANVLGDASHLDEDRLVFFGILSTPPSPEMNAALAQTTSPSLNFLLDYDGAVTRRYGAFGAPRTILLDPLLRAVANVPFDDPNGHGAQIRALTTTLPAPADHGGDRVPAPVLVVPRVLEFNVCDFLVELYDKYGGEESGFMLDNDGKTATVLNPALKRRRDMMIADPTLKQILRDRITRRLLPEIERFFQFKPTRMDRYMVSCYESADRGHFYRHRDNVNAGAQHRRFAVSLGLNGNYTGGGIRFPEFGRETYRPPVGGAVVFSCGMLHEVLPVETGRRFVFVPFLYGDEDAVLRARNNARLAEGETAYVPDTDLLFPPES